MIIQHFYPIFQSNLDTCTLPQHCMSSSIYFILNTLIKKKKHTSLHPLCVWLFWV